MDITPKSQEILTTLMEKCGQVAKPLAHVAKFGAKQVHIFIIDVDLLPEFLGESLRVHAAHSTVFNELADIKRPVVYVFEIVSAHSSKSVRDAAKSYKDKVLRAMPAFREESKVDYSSRVLYVGKVSTKSGFLARVYQHLGFWGAKKTQGMQLYHYARGLELKLELTVFEFEDDMADLLPILENTIAVHLRPLLGKHQ